MMENFDFFFHLIELLYVEFRTFHLHALFVVAVHFYFDSVDETRLCSFRSEKEKSFSFDSSFDRLVYL